MSKPIITERALLKLSAIWETLSFCMDCKCYHNQISRGVTLKRTGEKLGEICPQCNLTRIRRVLKKKYEREHN
jgi:hypothetical protein